MKDVQIHKVCSAAARMADVRVRIVRDEDVEPPFASMDLVFNPRPDSVCYKPMYDPTDGTEISRKFSEIDFIATAERVRELCGDGPEQTSEKRLDEIWKDELELIRQWRSGEVYGAVVERWDPARRMFEHVDSVYGLYGRDETLEEAFVLVRENGVDESSVVVCTDDSRLANS